MVAASEIASPPTPRASLGRLKLSGIALIGGAALGWSALRDWHDRHAFLINASESLPNWALLVETGRFPVRGDYVVFAPGRDPLVIKHFGVSPKPFAKIAYGVPGDVVTRMGDAVQVNGKTIAHLKRKTHQGEDLRPGPLGTIPPSCIYAGSPHKDGFDSRYAAIGFVCRDRLIGIGTPIL